MKLSADNIKIELESQDEIRDFWNVILFALDYEARRKEEGMPCMTDDEFRLAKQIVNAIEQFAKS